jgi:hypothetical protein
MTGHLARIVSILGLAAAILIVILIIGFYVIVNYSAVPTEFTCDHDD